MSANDNGRESLAGLTLDAVLGNDKRSAPQQRSTAQVNSATAAHMNKTLLDIIRDENPHRTLFGHKDKKSWKAFRERLRLRRAGAAWTSSIQIPTSDLPIQNTGGYGNARSMMSRRNSVRFTTMPNVDSGHQAAEAHHHPAGFRPQMSRGSSTRYGSTMKSSSHPDGDEFLVDTPAVGDEVQARSFRPQMSRRHSVRMSTPSCRMHDEEEEEAVQHGNRRLGTMLVEERALSAREAIVAQEAAEAAAAAQEHIGVAEEKEVEFSDAGDGDQGEGWDDGEGGVSMSLMDLLEETDRQMGFEGARYVVGEEDDEQTYYEDDDDDDGGNVVGETEHSCCVCMVRHKGAAFIPCGHSFCRLCSKELRAQRGNCPLCNDFILEIINIF